MQFSLKTLLEFMLGASVLCAVLFSAPAFIAFLVFAAILLFLPPVSISLIVYGSGHARAFGIGSLAAASPLYMSMSYLGMYVVAIVFDSDMLSSLGGSELYVRLAIGGFIMLVFTGGVIAVVMRKLLQPKTVETETPPETMKKAG